MALTVKVDVANPHWLHGTVTTVDGVRVALGLADPAGVTVAVRGTGPEKMLFVLTVIV